MTNASPDQMMDMVGVLDDQVDDIAEALGPLLKANLQDIAVKLPVVEKARLYVLATYAIDSLIFSYLRLNGANARDHPVMRELERVKQYVKKINEAKSKGAAAAAEAAREVTLNKEVAARFVKHDLAGNEKWDRERAEEKAREKAAAHAKFEELSRKIERREAENPSNGGEGEGEKNASSDSDEENPKDRFEHEDILTINGAEDTPEEKKKAKNEEEVNRILNTFKNHGVSASPSGKRRFQEPGAEEERKRERKANKKKRRQGRREAEKEGKFTRSGEEETQPKRGRGRRLRK